MKERIAGKMLKKSGIHGIGVGFTDPKNPRKGAAVIVYANNIAAAGIGPASSLSITSKGKKLTVPIRCVKSRTFKAYAAAQKYKGRIRPVIAGYSIGTTRVSGTAGLIVIPNANSGRRLILSNNHVLNPTNSGEYTATLQPGGADDGRIGRDRVGRLYRYITLSKTGNNYIDAALSIPLRNQLLTPRYATVGTVPGYVTSYRAGDRFKKVGRTTGRVNGTVESINTDVQINYGSELGDLTFKNQSVIKGRTPVSLPGDSGSVWLQRSDNYAAAVNFAGSDDGRTSISFPIQWAMQRFGIRVARPNGAGRIKSLKKSGAKHAYTRVLTAKELKTIKTRRVRIR